ncbi:energy-coupling factor transporter ATP-binding protein EcfA2 [Paraliobacillus ryukyuensis]|uniref:Energy-coupling factor transporter ATP-binding protein EcfA2 n=1 Tax=Paraliobacillus ryukyuensis TaxID=200904 RepID=A0A366DT03_9BACI|nr:energy-coupling factor ABC transporter ATP-binding protein [Paraliobacillus ryukyuensis]RBO93227.1 energy-coupling factor transport system ATP-binding protein [Paraliobacillus ryukyuensis]
MDISFNQVSYTYQPNTPFEHHALKDLSFTIPSGSFVAVVGHTGSGKSTLIQHLNGLLRPTAGKVQIGDYHLMANKKVTSIKSLRKHVGVVFQYPEHQLFEETIKKDIAFGPRNFNTPQAEIEKRIPEVMAAVNLPLAILERPPFDLSGGQMRRVAIAGVLAMDPSVLVLDEPTAGLDPKGQQQIMDMFYQLHQEKKLTTILVTHSMEDALRYADHMIILDHGSKYMEGRPVDIFKEKEKLQAVQLDLPEIIHFLRRIEERFGISIPYRKQTMAELATEIKTKLKGVSKHE